ncbi:MAG TPA: hydrogen peroxide-inducible genes activator [Azospira sp.]|nr:hydrogen peroxide-inducible genes activator [Azospira sp.]
MTLTEMRYIVALSRERHFGRAAEKCHVSQPTLSVALKKVEERLGVLLFERSAAEVRLTPVGEEVATQVERVLNEAQRVEEIASRGKDPFAGPLRLGVIYTIGPYLLPRLVPGLHRAVPHMPLYLQENFTHLLAESLKRGELDVIVVAQPFEEPGIVTQAVYDEPFRVLVPAGHPWADRKSIAPGELKGEELLVLGQGNCFRDQVVAACPRLTEPGGLERAYEGGSLETIRHMVASGTGVAVLPASAIEAAPPDPQLAVALPFSSPEPSRRIVLAWRVTFPRSQAIDAVRAAILDCPPPGVKVL